QAVHAQLLGPVDQPLDRTGTVEQAEVAVAVQMNKRRRVHVAIPRGWGIDRCGSLPATHSTACRPAAPEPGRKRRKGAGKVSPDAKRRHEGPGELPRGTRSWCSG